MKELNAQGCRLEGHPDHYRKFGFKNMPGFVYRGVPQEVVLALSFDGHILRERLRSTKDSKQMVSSRLHEGAYCDMWQTTRPQ